MFPSQQHWRNDADYSDNDSLARSTIYTRWMFQLCIHFEQQISNTPDHTCWLDIRIRSLSLSFQRDHLQLIWAAVSLLSWISDWWSIVSMKHFLGSLNVISFCTWLRHASICPLLQSGKYKTNKRTNCFHQETLLKNDFFYLTLLPSFLCAVVIIRRQQMTLQRCV